MAGACRVQAQGLTEVARISTCFLVDDSGLPGDFGADDAGRSTGSPAEVLSDLMRAAAHNGVPIDYLVRKSACPNPAVWQLLRLGMVHTAESRPRSWDGRFPASWRGFPAVLRLNESAAPFTAERATSVLSHRYCHTERTVRGMVPARALPRISYIYTG